MNRELIIATAYELAAEKLPGVDLDELVALVAELEPVDDLEAATLCLLVAIQLYPILRYGHGYPTKAQVRQLEGVRDAYLELRNALLKLDAELLARLPPQSRADPHKLWVAAELVDIEVEMQRDASELWTKRPASNQARAIHTLEALFEAERGTRYGYAIWISKCMALVGQTILPSHVAVVAGQEPPHADPLTRARAWTERILKKACEAGDDF